MLNHLIDPLPRRVMHTDGLLLRTLSSALCASFPNPSAHHPLTAIRAARQVVRDDAMFRTIKDFKGFDAACDDSPALSLLSDKQRRTVFLNLWLCGC